MKVFHFATMGDPSKGCYFTSNYYLKQKLKEKEYLTENPDEADIIYITENKGGLNYFKKYPNKIKVLQLVCSHPDLYCKLLKEECEKWDMWDERPFIWATTRKKEIEIADYILVYSEFSKKACIDNGVPENKIKVIPKGVETEIFVPKSIKKDMKFSVLVPGQQFIIKGLQYIIEAYKLNKDIKIILCGDKTKHMTKKGHRVYEMGKLIPKEIRNFGRVDRERLIELYNECDVVLCPSIEDSFNMCVLEALSCNKPVITTINTGAGELITHHKNGSIIPIRDSKAILKEIEYWKNNKPKGCRETALNNKIEDYVNNVINFLEALKNE